MQIPIDTELVTAGVYVAAVPLYLLLWRHSRHWYVALAVAAAILAFCALLRSDTVRAWAPVHHTPAPIVEPERAMGLIAEFAWMPGTTRGSSPRDVILESRLSAVFHTSGKAVATLLAYPVLPLSANRFSLSRPGFLSRPSG